MDQGRRTKKPTIAVDREPGAAKAAPGFCLVVLVGHNPGEIFLLSEARAVIGRDDKATIQVIDDGISRAHAAVTWDESSATFSLRDLGSRNGTMVNGVPVTKDQPLQAGDKIQLGVNTILRAGHEREPETIFAQTMYRALLRDQLTGAYNKRYFDELVITEFAYSARHKSPLALAAMDLDHFRSINDTYGHQHGDLILQAFAKLVHGIVRSEDILCRLDGDGFIVLSRGIDEAEAAALGDRVRHAVTAMTFTAAQRRIACTVSVGVAVYRDDSFKSPESFTLGVAKALRKAKELGRNRVRRYSTVG